LERDIPVLWLGKIATNHRRRLLKRIRAELKDYGVEILVIDGVENHYVFDEERTILLNRTKIVLNILRTKLDNNGLRYYLTAPNRALIVTEPTLAHTPFISGVHLVEAPTEQLADTIYYYLTHEEERQRIVEQAYQLVTTELTMKNGLSQILGRAIAVRNTVNAPNGANALYA
jgi:spore maturation protein CgeB